MEAVLPTRKPVLAILCSVGSFSAFTLGYKATKLLLCLLQEAPFQIAESESLCQESFDFLRIRSLACLASVEVSTEGPHR